MKKNKTDGKYKLLPAMVACKCPRCRAGKVYKHGAYSLKDRQIQARCDHCGLIYEKEPGYFYAAMYVGYMFIVAELVTAAVATNILSGSENPWLYVSILIPFVVALSPFNYRYSRILLLYFFTPGLRYQPEIKRNLEA